MEQNKEYFAFISYQRKDEQMAEWLQHQLEHYHLPHNVVNLHPELPKDVRPLFRDKTELAGGVLAKEIRIALENSRFLIVICSPNSAASEWVDKEIQTFISLGKGENIIPFIIDGEPYNQEKECFTETLRNLRGQEQELLGVNVAEMGREVASIKVVAQMLGLKFDTLWQRYEREKAEEERKIKEQRDRLLVAQSRFLAEKANTLIDEGDTYTARLLALEALPGDLQNIDRPLVAEAEQALRRAISAGQLLLEGHKDGVKTVVFSPDGKYVVSGSMDESICIWDSSTGAIVGIPLRGHTDSVESLAFSPDGKLLASATDTGEIIIWDFDNRSVVFKFPHTKAYSPIVFSPDGKHLVTATANYSLQKWEPLTGNPVGDAMKGHKDTVSALSYSHDGRLIASASWDKSIIIWDVLTSCPIMPPLVGHAKPDNSHGDEDCTPKFKVYGHMAYINSIAFSPDDMWIASGAWDKTICQWSVKTGEPILSSIGHSGQVTSIRYSPDNKKIASGASDGTIRFWDADNGRALLPPLRGHKSGITCITYSPDGKNIASASYDRSVRLWSVQEKESAPLQALIDQTQKLFKERQLTPEERKKYYLD